MNNTNKYKSDILRNTMNIPITTSANKIKNIKTAKNLDATISMSPLSKNSWTLDNCFSERLFSKNKDNEWIILDFIN